MAAASFGKESGMQGWQATATPSETIWVTYLLSGTLAQKAALIALTKDLQLEKRQKSINVYTESHYAFDTAYVNRAIYRE